MRIVLFYSGIESFNYFTNQIAQELNKRGIDTFILNLSDYSGGGEHSLNALTRFISSGVDMAIAFDGLGIKEELFIELWDSMNTLAVNILMDHPLRFHPTMQRHPKNYVQFCCDRNHVKYVKKYFGGEVLYVEFMPHAGTYTGEPDIAGYKDRPYDVLFSGTYYEPKGYLEQIRSQFPQNQVLQEFYFGLSDYMIENPQITTEQAVLDMRERMQLDVNEEMVKVLLSCAEPIDWMARMYYRGQIITALAREGFEVWLLGRGWENHIEASRKNVHIINDRVPFAQTLPVMAKAKINLNVMPWFKDGTHDRIFNVLLQGSLPVTDTSVWLMENFADEKDIVFYDLRKPDQLVKKVEKYLNHPLEAEAVIRAGFEKVSKRFVWKNCIDRILQVECGR